MIEVGKARNGSMILKNEGRLLASSFDPVREAQAWAKSLSPQLAGVENLIVMGVGCGYHLSEFQRLYPEISVLGIERTTQITDYALAWNQDLSAHQLIVAEKMSDLINWPNLRAALKTSYLSVQHGASQQINSEWCSEMQDFLAARTPEAFRLHLQLRPELQTLLDSEAVEALPRELVSIKTLQSLFVQLTPCTQERRLWHVLEELVV